jgi:hypothetical protein
MKNKKGENKMTTRLGILLVILAIVTTIGAFSFSGCQNDETAPVVPVEEPVAEPVADPNVE